MKGVPTLLLLLLLGAAEGRNIAHSVLERSLEHARPPLERQNGFMETKGPLPPRNEIQGIPQHELMHGEHKRMAPGALRETMQLPPLTKDSRAVHAPRLPPKHLTNDAPLAEHLHAIKPQDRVAPRSHMDLSQHPTADAARPSSVQHHEPASKGLLDIVSEMVKPQLIKPTPARNHRALSEGAGLMPGKMMTPHGMMVPHSRDNMMMSPPPHHKDDHDHDDAHHDHDHDDAHHGDDDHHHHGHEDADTQTDFPSIPQVLEMGVQTLVAAVQGKVESSDLKTRIESLKVELAAAVEEYKQVHGEDDEDVTTDADGNTVVIIVRAPDMEQVADAVFAGTGSGADGEFTKEDWDAAVHHTQEVCADDFEALCGNDAQQSYSGSSSDSSDSMDHHHHMGPHHWFRRLTDKNGGPPPPPPKKNSHKNGPPPHKGGGNPPPPPSSNSGPIGFGSRENDQCLLDQRTSASAACRIAIAQTEAIYRDLDSRGMAPRPPSHMHAHGSMFGIFLVLVACCCCVKCRRCHRAQKRKMKRTLAALHASNPVVKAAVEEAAGVSLPSPGWKMKVALAVDANPELKAAVAQAEQTYVPNSEDAKGCRKRIANPFAGVPTGHAGGRARKVLCVIYTIIFFFLFLMLSHHHHHGEGGGDSETDQSADSQDVQEGDSQDGGHGGGFFFVLAMFCCFMSCICFSCRLINEKCCGRSEPAVAVNVEDAPQIVPSTVATGTVTSFKYVELEKGACKV